VTLKVELPAHENQCERLVEHIDLFEKVGNSTADGWSNIVQHLDHEMLVEAGHEAPDLHSYCSDRRIAGPCEPISEGNQELRSEPPFLVKTFDQPGELTNLAPIGNSVDEHDEALGVDRQHVVALEHRHCEVTSALPAVRIEQDPDGIPGDVRVDQLVAVKVDGTALGRQEVAPHGQVCAGGDFDTLLERRQDGRAGDGFDAAARGRIFQEF